MEEEGKEGAGREGWGRLTLLQLMTLEGEDFSAFTEKEFEGGNHFSSYPPLRMHLSSWLRLLSPSSFLPPVLPLPLSLHPDPVEGSCCLLLKF